MRSLFRIGWLGPLGCLLPELWADSLHLLTSLSLSLYLPHLLVMAEEGSIMVHEEELTSGCLERVHQKNGEKHMRSLPSHPWNSTGHCLPLDFSTCYCVSSSTELSCYLLGNPLSVLSADIVFMAPLLCTSICH